jgi:hypothetical protein
MNEANYHDVMKVVERVVRPVRASRKRKRRMREELMAHLLGLVEDAESRLPGDEAAALQRATQRLGQATELTAQLQESVPRLDAVVRFNDLLAYRVGEAVLRRALRLGGVLGALMGLEFSLVAIVACLRTSLDTLPIWLQLIPLMAGSMGLLAFVFTLLEEAMRRAVRSPGRRSTGWAALIGAVSFLVIPGTAFVVYLAITRDPLSSAVEVGKGAATALFAPLALYLATGQIAEEIGYEEEWASLDIG